MMIGISWQRKGIPISMVSKRRKNQKPKSELQKLIVQNFPLQKRNSVILKYYWDVQIKEILDLWKKHKQIILYGPPGTGKTFLALGLANAIAKEKYELVQFHPSYEYEDFVEGIEVEVAPEGNQINYVPKPRLFRKLLRLC